MLNILNDFNDPKAPKMEELYKNYNEGNIVVTEEVEYQLKQMRMCFRFDISKYPPLVILISGSLMTGKSNLADFIQKYLSKEEY